MAGVCRGCKTLRLSSTLKKCFGPSFVTSKFKYTIPAAFISSVSFLGYRYSSEDRISGGILWQRGSRPFRSTHRSTTFHFQHGREEIEQTKPGTGKIKAKLEKMKEMVSGLAKLMDAEIRIRQLLLIVSIDAHERPCGLGIDTRNLGKN